MTVKDAKSLSRSAQRQVVEVKHGHGSPPSYGLQWQPVWAAKVDRIVINKDSTPSTATIWFPELRWQQAYDLLWGDMVRVRTNEPSAAFTVVFQGFVTSYLSDFSGGTDKNPAFERNAIVCHDYRWLLSISSFIFGQLARGPDDYSGYGTDSQAPIDGSYTWATGRRVIFNADGRPNSDPVLLTGLQGYDPTPDPLPIFDDTERAVPWTAREMLCYVLSPFYNKAYQYLPIPSPGRLPGLDHTDWDKVLNNISVDGLNVIEAIQIICRHLGWSFREDYKNDGTVTFVFYKPGAASRYSRSDQDTTILHRLHAPAVGESIEVAVEAGKKMLWSMSFAEDIAGIVNNPWGLGAPHRFEFTAELVPGWLDEDLLVPGWLDEYLEPLEPNVKGDNANLFFTEAELQDIIDPDSKSYYKNYHPRGNQFHRNVGRKWVLNESGHYTIAPPWAVDKDYKVGDLVTKGGNTRRCTFNHVSAWMGQSSYWQESTGYDRGMPFDFKGVIPAQYILDPEGKRIFAPFNRQLLPCLTVNKDSLSSIGILVEFSFDGAETWQIIPAAISALKNECGIYIEEANLAELVDRNEATISEDVAKEEKKLDGVQLNYWTSLCGDKLWERIFKDKDSDSVEAYPWQTRIRITASIQLDRRLVRQALPSSVSASPFHHSQIYDFSQKYGLAKRTLSSVFNNTDLGAYQTDSTDWFDKHLGAIREANKDMSISGQFTLERLWLGDDSGEPDFALGDCLEKITGREHPLSASFGGDTVYPEIIQIIYLPDKQKMKLITRDLRFAEVML